MSEKSNAERFATLSPPFEIDAAQTALAVYHLLKRAEPVSVEDIAKSTDYPIDLVESFLDEWPAVFRDDHGRVTGFMGVGLKPTRYRLHVDGNVIYPWCAWDTLFLPARLDTAVDIEAVSAIDKRPVQLHISRNSLEPPEETLHVSFPIVLDDNWTDDVLKNICHHVFFLLDDELDRWTDLRPDTFLLGVEEAFDVGARYNRHLFGRVLGSPMSATT